MPLKLTRISGNKNIHMRIMAHNYGSKCKAHVCTATAFGINSSVSAQCEKK